MRKSNENRSSGSMSKESLGKVINSSPTNNIQTTIMNTNNSSPGNKV